MDQEAKKQVEDMRNAAGITAEIALMFYRAAVGAGATEREAVKITQAYLGAMIFGNRQEEAPE